MALAVALADTFLLRSMVLCAVPTFLVPAFPTRDSQPESRCKITENFAVRHNLKTIIPPISSRSHHVPEQHLIWSSHEIYLEPMLITHRKKGSKETTI